MSQSPDIVVGPEKAQTYIQGWRSLIRLMKQDNSFSGHERHNALLNCGNGQFADISAASGFDFPEDGRAIALSDWDFDGKTDVWISNRTAPRVRLLRNQADHSNHFIGLKLSGNGRTTNADAIGARITVTLKNAPPKITSFRAGDGFISQSSGWVHVGLGDAERIEKLTIDWPGGDTEAIEGLQVDKFYTVKQGQGTGTVWTPPQATTLTHQPLSLPTSSTVARVFLTYPVPFPDLNLPPSNFPRLVNLRATWCAPCETELKEWAEQQDRFKQAGLGVYALCVDDPKQKSDSSAADFIESIAFPYPWTSATSEQINALDFVQRGLLDRWLDLPVPSSFLVDADGMLHAFYRGPVSTDQVIADLRLINALPQKRAAAATPFDGRWGSPPQSTNLNRITSQFVDHNDAAGAISYLETSLRFNDQLGATDKEIGDRHFSLGMLLDETNATAAAIPHLQEAMALLPHDLRSRQRLASVYTREKQLGKALAVTQQALTLKPNDITLLYQRAELARQTDDLEAAIKDYRAVLRAQPSHLLASNTLAWILSTNSNADLRNGPEALKLALQACQRTKFRHPNLLDTLSVAYAENAQFADAEKIANQAKEIFTEAGATELAEKCQLRAEQFARGEPWHE